MNIPAFLEEQHCAFAVMPHPTTYTAQEMAHELHVPGREVAKTVLLRAGGDDYVVAVVPAHKRVDLHRTSELFGGREMTLAHEADMQEHCPDCERGVLPPFGSRYGMKTIVDESLADDEAIVFEGNTHNEAIQMRFDEFRRLEEPLIAPIAQ
ncbi:MAG: YbaK/EbsC family protein [Planctomycetes bacterium]|nr:YbaK/EbsC family protein [Planctomycetota bacterium]